MVPIILFVLLSSATSSIYASDLPPVILGLGGSQMQATVSSPSFDGWCSILERIMAHFKNIFLVWMNPTIWLPAVDKCSVKLLELAYNNVTRKTTDLPTVKIEVFEFGDPHLVEYMVDYDTIFGAGIYPSEFQLLKHPRNVFGTDTQARMGNILSLSFTYLVEESVVTSWLCMGGERLRCKDIIIRPLGEYSMGVFTSKTLAPHSQPASDAGLLHKRLEDVIKYVYFLDESQEFFKNLKHLVEETYRINGNRKIVFVTHSYGGPMTITFLRMQTQHWKEKYIRSMISLSAVLGGTMRTIQQDVSGDYFEPYSFGYFDSDVKDALRTWPSVAFLMPNKKLWENKVLVRGPQKNYTISNINEFFEDLGDTNIWEMLKDQQRDVSLEPPGVEYHCLYSTTEKDSTPEMLTYHEPSHYPGSPGIVYGPGDGTVNLRSLDYCKEWAKQQTERVEVKHFSNLGHIEIINNEGVIDYIQTILKNYAHEDIAAKR